LFSQNVNQADSTSSLTQLCFIIAHSGIRVLVQIMFLHNRKK